ncbi:Gfo/Idh/MocA family protein [Pengzhenrongella frigida]|uniref:Gfo/Idh/MocA family oxidoreductase n=1 Tax=Pengzhenrongella frigida TaxID=1259133 RepID=A0A4V1ZGZ7_9MICO|nr:Gfo/Idh/MocA family oxidoreductase [Cellulomonas sp. HLT2-17]RYV50284.1 Gfo/Idh/MocA family oxidoreductase [Cellulomonas sp. HLT2-17]
MSEQGAGQRLRVGLIGYGDAGRGIHARLLRAAGHVVTHVAVRNTERAAAAQADWPGVVLVPSVAALVELGGDLDLVVIASPTGNHVENALAVIAAGLPLVIDKPLAPDSAGAQAVVAAATAAGVPLTVFQNRRWDSEQLTLRALLADGTLGTVHRFERRWERWRPVPKDRWRENDPIAGGLLLDLGAHLVDSAVQLFGPATSVYAEIRALTTPTPDDVFLALQHPGGVVSHLWAGGLTGAPGPRTRVLGSAGAYLVTSFEGEPTPFAELDEAAPGGSEGHEGWLVHGSDRVAVPRVSGGHVDFYRAAGRWILAGGPVPVDPQDAVRTARVLEAAVVSAREQRVVQLG